MQEIKMTKEPSILGVWYVIAVDAPFQYHLFTFHADGTMVQANPDAGDPLTSDSDGMGVWKLTGKTVKGKFVEITANRKTNKFKSRGEISFVLEVTGDTFLGTFSANFYDE